MRLELHPTLATTTSTASTAVHAVARRPDEQARPSTPRHGPAEKYISYEFQKGQNKQKRQG